MNVLPIILCGGFGSRLSPLSSEELPKQFIPFIEHKYSFFQKTFKRVRKVFFTEKIIICCNVKHIDLIKKQIKDINEDNYILLAEKEKRNTFPSILISLQFAKKYHSDVLFVTPSDNYIYNDDNYIKNVYTSVLHSFIYKKHVLFGIKPTRADSNYGYIQINDKEKIHMFYNIKSFIEKPDVKTAKDFIKNSNYFWNSGSFVFNFDKLINDIKKHSIDMFVKYKNENFLEKKYNNLYITNDNFLNLPTKQIDKEIIEKSNNIVCQKSTFEWYDIGSFEVINHLIKKGKIQISEEYYFLIKKYKSFLKLRSSL